MGACGNQKSRKKNKSNQKNGVTRNSHIDESKLDKESVSIFMKKSLFTIKDHIGSGFLCLIPAPVLITTTETLNENDLEIGKEIELLFNDHKIIKKIFIDKNRNTIFIKKINEDDFDITIVQLRPEGDNLNDLEFLIKLSANKSIILKPKDK